MKTRAKKGGEYGANGEWYEGGKFINTVPENKKGMAKGKKSTKKVEVEPFKYAVRPRENLKPLMTSSGLGTLTSIKPIQGFKEIDGIYVNTEYAAYNRLTHDEILRFVHLSNRFSLGDRWIDENGETFGIDG